MNHFIHVRYPDKIVRFDICKNYGLDKQLMLGEKPIPRKVSVQDINFDYKFLLNLLPIEIWLNIFDILHEEALVRYKKLVGTEIEYNIHRLFKKKNYEINYRDFEIKIRASPGIWQFYSTMYNEKDVREYYGYTAYICNDNLELINKLSDYTPKFTKCRCMEGRIHQKDAWGMCLTTDYDEDFVFTEGFNSQRIINKLELHKKNGKIKTFKTIEYYTNLSKQIIDNFYSKKDRIRNTY